MFEVEAEEGAVSVLCIAADRDRDNVGREPRRREAT
jgi:hypothetical protein